MRTGLCGTRKRKPEAIEGEFFFLEGWGRGSEGSLLPNDPEPAGNNVGQLEVARGKNSRRAKEGTAKWRDCRGKDGGGGDAKRLSLIAARAMEYERVTVVRPRQSRRQLAVSERTGSSEAEALGVRWAAQGIRLRLHYSR